MNYQVLIAEDEAVTRNAVHSSLTELLPTADFLLAENGKQAIELAERNGGVQLAFLDIKMPVMEGIEAARSLRAAWPNCQILFLTAYSEFSYMKEALNIGAVDYLLKPFTQTALAAALQKALGQLTLYENEQKLGQHFQSQIEKLSQWVDNQVLLNVISEQQSEESILQQFRRRGLHFQAGVFAAIRVPQGASLSRVSGMLRGHNWGAGIKLFFYAQQNTILVLFAAPSAYQMNSGFTERIEQFCCKTENLMHLRLSCAAGQPFEQLSDAAYRCFLSFAALHQCTEEAPFLPMDGEQPSSLAAYLADRLTDSQAFCTAVQAYLEFMEMQQFKPDHIRQKLFDALSHVVQSCPPSVMQELRGTVLASESTEALTGLLPHMRQKLLAASASAMVRSENADPKSLIARYLQQHFTENLTLEAVAADMGHAPTYFSKLFKKLFGQTFISYLGELRLERAKELLVTTDMNVKEIAFTAGFRDAAYFTSLFRRAVEMTPTEYRTRHTEEESAT